MSANNPITRRTRSATKKNYYAEVITIDSSSESEISDCESNKKSRKKIVLKKEDLRKTEKTPKKVNLVRKTDEESTKQDVKYNKVRNDQNVPPKSPPTPRKQKSHIPEKEFLSERLITPPKQKKTVTKENVLSPSSLLNKLNLNSPPPKTNTPAEKKCAKSLFEYNSTYQNARKALHGTVPTHMPGRQKEHKELLDFINEHMENIKSGTLYISGPPGTGKTASLSVILQKPEFSEYKQVYVNCTAIKSSGSIFSKITKELDLKSLGRSEKDYLTCIENHLTKTKKMIILVLDELDQLESKKQSILYTIFEWPAKPKAKLLLIGIANALDLTDRVLPRLQIHCKLKPKLMHFAPYTKQQIVEIFTERLKEAGVLDVFSPVAIQMLAGKVAAVSGDVRRALDIGRRVIELVEQNKKNEIFEAIGEIENNDIKKLEPPKAVDLKQVVNVLNNVYGTSQSLESDDDSFPLQQKIVLCTLLLILKKGRNKDVTVGKLHDVYKKVCNNKNLSAVDQAEFVGLCSLIETRGILRVSGKKEPRLNKVNLQWNEEEVQAALKDKKLIYTILEDYNSLGKL